MPERDSDSDLHRANLDQLSALLSLGDDDQASWSEADLLAVFAHQLQSRLSEELVAVDPQAAQRVEQWRPGRSAEATFADLLFAENPSIPLLNAVRSYSKRQGPALPFEISAVLYLLAIAAAQVQGGVQISKVDPETQRGKMEWAAARPWIDSPSRSLLERAARAMR